MAVDFEQFSQIVKRYALALTRDYATAEDLAQETMLRAIRHQDKLSQIERPHGWLLTVVTNLWRDQLRKQQRRPAPQSLNFEAANVSDGPHTIAETNEELARVLASFQDLPATQRQVLYLRTVEECSIDEVSSILNISRASVKTNLSIARKTMREKHLKRLTDETK